MTTATLNNKTSGSLNLFVITHLAGAKPVVIISDVQLSAIFGVYSNLRMRTTFASWKETQTPVPLSVTYSPKSEIGKPLRADWPGLLRQVENEGTA